MAYSTRQKKEILNFLEKNPSSHFTVEEIKEGLKKDDIEVSTSTLYRFVDSLYNEGKIRKFMTNNVSKACFQFVSDDECTNHFHLVCSKCGKLIHLDCDRVDDLIHHVEEDHEFKIDITKIVFYGICKECQK